MGADLSSRERFPLLWNAYHYGDDTQEMRARRMADFERGFFLAYGRAPSLGDMFAASMGRTVDDPAYQKVMDEAVYETTGEHLFDEFEDEYLEADYEDRWYYDEPDWGWEDDLW